MENTRKPPATVLEYLGITKSIDLVREFYSCGVLDPHISRLSQPGSRRPLPGQSRFGEMRTATVPRRHDRVVEHMALAQRISANELPAQSC